MDRSAIEVLVRRWTTEAVAEGRDEVFDELLAEDVQDSSGGATSTGAATFRARARAVRAAFSDVVVRVDALVVEGENVAVRWTLTGRHTSPILGVPATGREVALRGVNFQRVRDGRVVEHWTLADLAGLARQLGA